MTAETEVRRTDFATLRADRSNWSIAAAAACLRARRSLAACSDAALKLFRPVAHVELHSSQSAASASRSASGMLH